MELDVNFDLYPMERWALYRVLILRSLGISQEQDQGRYNPDHSTMESELDNFQYAMYGRTFKLLKERDTSRASVFASFGGLVLKLSGRIEELDKF
jgi:DNA-directed RNA polymerase I, II, and III subunit RPABC3